MGKGIRTVGDLIAFLQKQDAATPVMTNGFDEEGIDWLYIEEGVEVIKLAEKNSYASHERVGSLKSWEKTEGEPFKALLLR